MPPTHASIRRGTCARTCFSSAWSASAFFFASTLRRRSLDRSSTFATSSASTVPSAPTAAERLSTAQSSLSGSASHSGVRARAGLEVLSAAGGLDACHRSWSSHEFAQSHA